VETLFRLFLIGVAFMASTCSPGGGTEPTPTPVPAVSPTATATPGPRMLGTVDPDSGLPLATVLVRDSETSPAQTVTVEITATPSERALGLMNRQSLPQDRGMLFLFPADTTTRFWMKNTLVPLDIAFISAEGRIVGISEGKPLDTTLVGPGAPYRFVLEMNRGWFERHDFAVGSLLELPPGLPAAQ
jgi:uncharacterized membrane protein (UPF0127 family)